MSLLADDVMTDSAAAVDVPAYAFSGKAADNALMSKLTAKAKTVSKTHPEPNPEPIPETPAEPEKPHGRSVDDLMERLFLLKN